METMTFKVDITKPAGRKLARELSENKYVRISCPPELLENTFTHEEVWSKFEKRFNEHYGSNVKFNYQI